MKLFVVAIAIIFLGKLSLAESNSATQPNESSLEFPLSIPSQTISGEWYHKIFRRVAFDIDTLLRESGIQVEACSYKNQQTGQVKNYKALTYCAMDHYIDSMNYNNSVGLTFFWVKGKNEKMIPVRIDWHPTEEGWKGSFKELFTLEKESLSNVLSKLRPKNKSDQMRKARFKFNFLGRLKMSFPANTHLDEIFSQENIFFKMLKMDHASQISFEMNPTGIKNNKVQYHGQILVSQEALVNATGDIISLDFETNINLLNMKRPFESRGEIHSGLDLEGSLR